VKRELILINDDKDPVLTFKDLEVEMMDYIFVRVFDGKEAVEKALINYPALIILKRKMPAWDGLEATKMLRNSVACKNTPILMIIEPNATSKFITQAIECGVDDFLIKPFSRIEFKTRIELLLKQANFIKQTIKLKNNEFNSTAIQLAGNVKFKESLQSKLELLVEDTNNAKGKNILDEAINKIKIDNKLNNLDNIRKNISNKNYNFRLKLMSKHPNITPAELKLCILLRLNFNTREISVISCQTYDSVRVSRTRLREKLNLESSVKLTNYLMQF